MTKINRFFVLLWLSTFTVFPCSGSRLHHPKVVVVGCTRDLSPDESNVGRANIRDRDNKSDSSEIKPFPEPEPASVEDSDSDSNNDNGEDDDNYYWTEDETMSTVVAVGTIIVLVLGSIGFCMCCRQIVSCCCCHKPPDDQFPFVTTRQRILRNYNSLHPDSQTTTHVVYHTFPSSQTDSPTKKDSNEVRAKVLQNIFDRTHDLEMCRRGHSDSDLDEPPPPYSATPPTPPPTPAYRGSISYPMDV